MVTLAGKPAKRSFCRYTLDVRVGARHIEARLPFRARAAYDYPALVALRNLDGRPGDEIAVTVVAGASTSFIKIYAVRHTRLRALRIVYGPMPRSMPLNTLTFGGYAVDYQSLECARQARPPILVWADYHVRHDLRHYNVVRYRFRVRGTRLVPLAPTRAVVKRGDGGLAPFRGCPTS